MTAFGSAKSEDGGENRVRCLYCGANNFPSSPTCWQCGRPLQALRSGPLAAEQVISRPSPVSPSPGGRVASTEPISPSLAPKAAAALGLMFPYIGLPVGMVFLMLDDARRTQIGWVTIWWSIAGSVLSLLFLLLTLGPTLALLKSFLPNAGHGGGIPGLPTSGGDTGDLNLLLPYLRQSCQQILQASCLKLAF